MAIVKDWRKSRELVMDMENSFDDMINEIKKLNKIYNALSKQLENDNSSNENNEFLKDSINENLKKMKESEDNIENDKKKMIYSFSNIIELIFMNIEEINGN